MIEHEQLLEFVEDEDDYPVMLYLAKIGEVIDWKEKSPDEVLYVPEKMFQSVAGEFIEQIGLGGFYGKTILDDRLIEILLHCGEKENCSNAQKVILEVIRNFVNFCVQKSNSHYLAFEGP